MDSLKLIFLPLNPLASGAHTWSDNSKKTSYIRVMFKINLKRDCKTTIPNQIFLNMLPYYQDISICIRPCVILLQK